jgi:Prokaryotic cytochrome b561
MSATRVISRPQAVGGTGDRILRYTLGERVNHWIAGLSYIYLMITGPAFWSPYMFRLAILVGGGPTARSWHPWIGLLFAASVLWMYKIWRRDMVVTEADRAWQGAIRHYIRNEDEDLPPIGRFNYGQKLFFWLMFYGVILLLLSGLSCGSRNPFRGVCAGYATLPSPPHHRRPRNHRRLHHSCVHGHGHGARRLQFHHPRGSFRCLGKNASSVQPSGR